jgi:hypothetical protein
LIGPAKVMLSLSKEDGFMHVGIKKSHLKSGKIG